jgi:hypothetical protein
MDESALRDAFTQARHRVPVSRANCLGPDDLQALATSAGDTPKRLDQLVHISTCGSCRAEFDLLRTASQAAPVRTARPAMRWAPAMAAAAVITIVSTVMLTRSNEDDVMRGSGESGAFRIVNVADDRDSVSMIWTAVPQAVRYDVVGWLGDGSPAFTVQTTDTVAGGRRAAGSITRWTVTASLLDGTTRTAEATGR